MITLLATIFAFGLIVLIHECGHFMAAKAFNMQVDEFAIGFGPILFSKQGSETLYTIRAIPLGGFNRIAGMTPDENLNERSFLNQAVWKRFIVIAAGAVMNFILAIVLFFVIFANIGIQTPSGEPVIGGIVEHSPASQINLQVGDKITNIDGHNITKWSDITPSLKNCGEKLIPITVVRDNKIVTEKILPQFADKQVVIGIYPQFIKKDISILESFNLAIKRTVDIINQMTVGLLKVIFGKAEANLSGPIGVAQMAGKVANVGFIPLLSFTALLSINLGVINLFPLPVLDGGHLVMLLIEGITGKKLPEKALIIIQLSGVVILALLFLYATYSDLIHIFK